MPYAGYTQGSGPPHGHIERRKQLLKSCSRCGRVHERGACPIKRERKREEPTEVRRFRHSRKWTETAIVIRQRDRSLCQACLHEDPPRYQFADLSVHHIVPLHECMDAALEPANLITLCRRHHELAEEGEIDRKTLLNWANESAHRWERKS